jgi:hypothetical protein
MALQHLLVVNDREWMQGSVFDRVGVCTYMDLCRYHLGAKRISTRDFQSWKREEIAIVGSETFLGVIGMPRPSCLLEQNLTLPFWARTTASSAVDNFSGDLQNVHILLLYKTSNGTIYPSSCYTPETAAEGKVCSVIYVFLRHGRRSPMSPGGSCLNSITSIRSLLIKR